jgi:hypothetical protein
MVQTAARLTDHVFPHLSVRQWVFSVPKRLRYFMQRDSTTLKMMLRIFLQVIAQTLQTHTPGAANEDKVAQHIGAAAFIHRFGSSLYEHVHLHGCVLDRVTGDSLLPWKRVFAGDCSRCALDLRNSHVTGSYVSGRASQLFSLLTFKIERQEWKKTYTCNAA